MCQHNRSLLSIGMMMFTLVAGLNLCAAADDVLPPVVRLRVPQNRVEQVFPPSSPLVSMPVAEFEELLEAASQAQDAGPTPDSIPRILRASHSVTVVGNALKGISAFEVQPHASRLSPLILSPWSPALTDDFRVLDPAAILRTTDDGTLALWLQPGANRIVRISWEQTARPGTDGRYFQLRLPEADLASIDLDIPATSSLSARSESWKGPLATAESQRRYYQYRGPISADPFELKIYENALAPPRTPLWIGGATRISLVDARASWEGSWSVDPGDSRLRPLQIDLDPDLDVLAVSGPAVDNYTIADLPAGSHRLTVRFLEAQEGPTNLVIRGLASAPGEGRWKIPGVRLNDAAWIGGTTIVRVGPSRILESDKALAGIPAQVAGELESEVPPISGPGSVQLSYLATDPGSPAELTFKRPASSSFAEVRGQLLLGSRAPRLEAAITWTIDRLRPFSLSLELPARWTPDQVALGGVSEVLTWQTEPRVGGGVRVVIPVPPTLDVTQPLIVSLSAVLGEPSSSADLEPLELPRILPAGTRLLDERWVAWTEPGYSLRPLDLKGLAWIEPASVGLEPPATAEAGLAWRWNAAEATGSILVEPRDIPPRAQIIEIIETSAEHQRCQFRVELDLGETSLRSIPIGWIGPGSPPSSWRIEGTSGGTTATLVPSPREAGQNVRDNQATTWSVLQLPTPRKGRLILTAVQNLPWENGGSLPILVLTDRFRASGAILLGVDPSTRSTVAATGLRALDPSLAFSRLLALLPEEERASLADRAATSLVRWAHAQGYEPGDQPVSLKLETETLSPAGSEGVIREASITIPLVLDGVQHSRLLLQVVPCSVKVLGVELPPSSTLESVLVDGQTVSPTLGSDGLSIPLPSTSVSRPSCSVLIEYDIAQPPGAYPEDTLSCIAPRFSMTCLALTWQVASAGTPEILSRSSGLVDARPDDLRPWYRRLLGASLQAWSRQSPALSVDQLFDLRQKTPLIGRDGIALGDLLTRWDSSRWPLVVDRPALAAAGWSPRKRLRPPQEEGSTETTADPLSSFLSFGLTLIPFDNYLLLTTINAQPEPADRALYLESWSQALRQAVHLGADAKGRFLSATRWIETELPETLTGADAANTLGTTFDRRTHWLHSVGWPTLSVSLRDRAEIVKPALTWAAGLAVFSFLVSFRRFQPSLKARVLLFVLAVTCLILNRWQAGFTTYATGAFMGAVGALGFWLGSSLRRRDVPPTPPDVGSTVLRSPSRSAVEIGLMLSTFLATSWMVSTVSAQVPGGPAEGRILAVLPVQGDEEPTQVWILKKDNDRLRLLAAASRQVPPQTTRPWAQQVTHRLNPLPGGSLDITSRYVLWSASETPVPWNLPIGPAKQLEARLDTQGAPLDLASTGTSARVWIDKPGQHVLEYRRVLDLGARRDASAATLPLNPLPQARVEGNLPLELRMTSSRVLAGPTEEKASPIGPVHFIAFAPNTAVNEPLESAGTVDSLVLWDAEPGGDRIRVQLTYRGVGPRTELRVALAADAIVRAVRVEGLIDSETLAADDGAAIWVGRLDSPLVDGGQLELDLWRPLANSEALSRGQPRVLPLIQPLQVTPAAATMVLRKPVGWFAETQARADRELLLPPSLPEGWSFSSSPLPLELFDVVPLEPGLEFSVRLGPAAGRVVVQPEVEVTLRRGRLDVLTVARVLALTRPYRQLEVSFPATWQPIEVAGEGLTSWDVTASGQLRLRFDGPDQPTRLIRLRGWMPVETDPEGTGDQAIETPLPWPSWGRARAEPGLLTLFPGREKSPQVFGPEGPIEPLPADPLAAASAAEQPVLRYQVSGRATPARLQWVSDSARTQVNVRGLLTLYPTEALWTASVRYKVAGAPLDTLILSLPDEWATHARFEMPGVAADISRESRGGQTFWTLKTDRPLVGGPSGCWCVASEPTTLRGRYLCLTFCLAGAGKRRRC